MLSLLPAKKLDTFKKQAKRVTKSVLVSRQSCLSGQSLHRQILMIAVYSDGPSRGQA